jgi:hypothetical protein
MIDEYANIPNPEREPLIAEIRQAFATVSREGGVSWTECDARDANATEEECAAVRAMDTDRHWTELLDNPTWSPSPGTGNLCFIDPIGFRYYLPPLLIRFANGDLPVWPELIEHVHRFVREQPNLFDKPMSRSIARFLLFMARTDTSWQYEDDPNPWLRALKAGWDKYLL